jgi:hypothetical protein
MYDDDAANYVADSLSGFDREDEANNTKDDPE